MNILKSKHKLLLIMCVAVITFGLVATAGAWNRPANPTMDYVPQNCGIYDTYYKNFKESDCRVCHGASTAPRHHSTDWALDGNCLYCHNEFPVVIPPVRNCKECHDDNWAKHPDLYGFPHHKTGWADADNCVKCHDPNLLVETNTVLPPDYEPSTTTPSPFSCENCHWPSGSVPHEAATPDGNTTTFATDWATWAGVPKPTTYPTGADPQPIEPNGPVKNGSLWWDGDPLVIAGSALNSQRPDAWLMGDKPYQPATGTLDLYRGTHHEVNGLVRPKCYNCHATNPDSDPSYDPLNPYLIRMCENCHDRFTLHAISEHVTTNDIYTLNSTLNNSVTDNNKCIACHGDNLGTLPPLPSAIVEVKRIQPNTGGTGKASFGSPGITLAITPVGGTGFGTQWNGQLEILGDGIPDDDGICDTGEACYEASEAVLLTGIDSAGSPVIDFVAPVDPDKWTDTQIEFKIPGWTFKAGSSVTIEVNQLVDPAGPVVRKLQKSTAAVSAQVNKHPEISTLVPSSGSYGQKVVVKGVGFDPGTVGSKEKIWAEEDPMGSGIRYGYATYVELIASNDRYRIRPAKTTLVSDAKIKIELDKMLDLNTGAEVPPDQLYEGAWQVVVITDYFKDDGDIDYISDAGVIDSGDTLLWSEESDPIIFNSLDGPFITLVSPNKQNAKKFVELCGYNFGPFVSGSSKVNVGGKVVDDIPAGDEITTWNDTMIVFKVPTFGVYPKTKPVYVTTDTGKVSVKVTCPNALCLKVKPPAP